MPAFDQSRLDDALKQLTYGFYLLTTRADGKELKTRDKDWVAAGTVSWAMQSSFEPPLLTVAIQKDSDLNETIQQSQVFSITVLSQLEEDLIGRFAKNSDVDYANTSVNGISYREGETGAPLLNCGIVTLECRLEDALTTNGDHLLFVGRIVAVHSGNNGDPVTERDTRQQYEGVSARS